FAASNAGRFEPGAKIEIKLRMEGQGTTDKSLFKGVVVRHAVEASGESLLLRIGLKDAAVKLSTARTSAVFRKLSDTDIVRKLVQRAGLSAGTIASTVPKHFEMVQYNCTPWDFILSRADALGMLVSVEDGVLSLSKIAVSGQPKHDFQYGIHDFREIEIEAD